MRSVQEDRLGKFKALCFTPWLQAGFQHGFLDCSLDVSTRRSEDNEFKRLASTLGADESRWLGQPHSDLLIVVNEIGRYVANLSSPGSASQAPLEQADGWVVMPQKRGGRKTLFNIVTADCLPVILFCEKSKTRGLLHCGWRSAVQGILPKAIRRMSEAEKCNQESISMVIGPGAGGCCYEVDQAVAERFEEAWATANRRSIAEQENNSAIGPRGCIRPSEKGEDTFRCSIPELLRFQALSEGIRPGKIHQTAICTIESQKYFSFRRDGEKSGRQLSFIIA